MPVHEILIRIALESSEGSDVSSEFLLLVCIKNGYEEKLDSNLVGYMCVSMRVQIRFLYTDVN